MAESTSLAPTHAIAVHAVRQSKSGVWQVSLIQAGMWRTCQSERDARTIADALDLAKAVRRGEAGGMETARVLTEASKILTMTPWELWAVNLVTGAAILACGEIALQKTLRAHG